MCIRDRFNILQNIKKEKLAVKNSLFWILPILSVIIITLNIDFVDKITTALGIEATTNVVFFLGFIFLIIVCFDLSKRSSEQRKEILKLAQELAILKNKLEKDKR